MLIICDLFPSHCCMYLLHSVPTTTMGEVFYVIGTRTSGPPCLSQQLRPVTGKEGSDLLLHEEMFLQSLVVCSVHASCMNRKVFGYSERPGFPMQTEKYIWKNYNGECVNCVCSSSWLVCILMVLINGINILVRHWCDTLLSSLSHCVHKSKFVHPLVGMRNIAMHRRISMPTGLTSLVSEDVWWEIQMRNRSDFSCRTQDSFLSPGIWHVGRLTFRRDCI